MSFLTVLKYVSVVANFLTMAMVDPNHEVMVVIKFDPENKKFAFKPIGSAELGDISKLDPNVSFEFQ